jgi:hypothetical protein
MLNDEILKVLKRPENSSEAIVKRQDFLGKNKTIFWKATRVKNFNH